MNSQRRITPTAALTLEQKLEAAMADVPLTPDEEALYYELLRAMQEKKKSVTGLLNPETRTVN